MKSISTAAGVILVVSLAFASCDKDRGAAKAGPVLRTDSAGITVVTSSAPSIDTAHAWHVYGPEVTIGKAGGAPTGELFRVWSALRRSDGSIVIGNAGTFDVRFFDRTGAYVSTAGRFGRGPGEYQDVNQIFAMRGDSVGVWDNAEHRITVYDSKGIRARVTPVEVAGPFTRILDVSDNGDLLISAMDFGYYTKQPRPADRSQFAIRVGNAGRVDTLGSYFDQRGGSGEEITYFGAYGGLLYCGGALASWRSDRYEIVVYNPAGAVKRIIRRAFVPEKITDAFFEEFKRNELARILGSSEGGGRMPPQLAEKNRRMMATAKHPEFFPPISDVQCDADRNYWVREWPPAQLDDESRWSVFSPDGEWLTQVTMPKGLLVLQIGRNFVLAHTRPEAEVEQVMVYKLSR